jgi:hypothetical protein
MAILDALPGLAASVTVVVKELTEYESHQEELEEPSANITISRYVESISDCVFAIKLEISPLFRFDCPRLEFQVFIDGKHVTGILCGSHLLKHGHWITKVSGMTIQLPNGREGKRDFRFASVKTSNKHLRNPARYRSNTRPQSIMPMMCESRVTG